MGVVHEVGEEEHRAREGDPRRLVAREEGGEGGQDDEAPAPEGQEVDPGAEQPAPRGAGPGGGRTRRRGRAARRGRGPARSACSRPPSSGELAKRPVGLSSRQRPALWSGDGWAGRRAARCGHGRGRRAAGGSFGSRAGSAWARWRSPAIRASGEGPLPGGDGRRPSAMTSTSPGFIVKSAGRLAVREVESPSPAAVTWRAHPPASAAVTVASPIRTESSDQRTSTAPAAGRPAGWRRGGDDEGEVGRDAELLLVEERAERGHLAAVRHPRRARRSRPS